MEIQVLSIIMTTYLGSMQIRFIIILKKMASLLGIVKADGTLLDGKLNKKSSEMLGDRKIINKMRRSEKKIANYIRKVGNSKVGGKPFKPGARGPKRNCGGV
ncbi:hypothetical protein [Pectobacterium parmentieri]|uniref:hypothetical protein n=1 Tax=Pectobacterium parmentieri TaxID=1905730 RepID=UPI00051A1C3F|nr:hypothetical protein [Pectobacterium parmentieri]AOR60335.1 hypothetical protein A8F97_15750 [Pectobacterium parmentieri]